MQRFTVQYVRVLDFVCTETNTVASAPAVIGLVFMSRFRSQKGQCYTYMKEFKICIVWISITITVCIKDYRCIVLVFISSYPKVRYPRLGLFKQTPETSCVQETIKFSCSLWLGGACKYVFFSIGALNNRISGIRPTGYPVLGKISIWCIFKNYPTTVRSKC